MSVLIKRIDSSSGGGSSKGYPPGNVTNVTIKGGYKKVTIKWTDPDDVVIGDKTLSTWKSTTLVRKKGSIPTSIKDGIVILETTEKNKYKNTEYSDNNLEIGTYYYRFFVCNTDKIYNNDSSMIYSAAVVEFDHILSNNSWEQIAAASESGMASSLWNIGDEIDIELKAFADSDGIEISAQTITLQIWDFNHFDKSDGSGKAGIVFGMKHLMKSYQQMNSSDTNYGGWNDTAMKKTVMANILKSMPSNLRSYIKEVNTYANQGGSSSSSSKGLLSKDKVFLPGMTEMFGSSYWTSQSVTESGQKQFPIFTNDNSRIKKMSNGSGDAYWWWLRSPLYSNTYYFCNVYADGSYYDRDASYNYGVCFCFCV